MATLSSNPTFEEVDQHVNAADLTPFSAGGAHHAATRSVGATAQAIPANICAAYKIVKPILNLLLNVPLIPASWKAAIKVFMDVLNAICP